MVQPATVSQNILVLIQCEWWWWQLKPGKMISWRWSVNDNISECQNPKPALFSVRPYSVEEAKINLDSFWAIFALICHLCLFRRGYLDSDESVHKSSSKSCFQSPGTPREDWHVGGLMCKQFPFTQKPADFLSWVAFPLWLNCCLI